MDSNIMNVKDCWIHLMLALYSYVRICLWDGIFLFHTLGMREIEFEFLGKKISQTVKYMCIKYIKE